ncbi:uncharacterized protein N7503_002576 [Penicillium pulvis]|uniref:uncharacterized protein n=1 Tax=Penicillium pulvis TaxID=1562058 RepID=UPI002548B13D|nr:uncharacterized protein N7503_002576 [Penicillium pulvis]KAJ5810358.1 hypothetical protein N7503_002576 [Penicillium pulvis]
MADHNTTARVAQSASPMSIKSDRCIEAPRDTCQRCFLRMEKFPGHHCVWSEGRKRCHYCGTVDHRCIPLPDEFQDEAELAMLRPASELPSLVRGIRRKISNRTKRINRERLSESAAATPATETESESEDEDNGSDEDYDPDFALNEQLCSSDEAYENSEMDAASEEQLQCCLTSAVAYEDSEIDVAAEEQLQSSLAEEAWELEVKEEPVSWHSQTQLEQWGRWEREHWQIE